jgi:hypothetical protein
MMISGGFMAEVNRGFDAIFRERVRFEPSGNHGQDEGLLLQVLRARLGGVRVGLDAVADRLTGDLAENLHHIHSLLARDVDAIEADIEIVRRHGEEYGNGSKS